MKMGDKQSERKCTLCNGPAFSNCSACKTVSYCGVEHQKKDWPKHKYQCRPFKVCKSREMGRFLVASRDIPANSVIFAEAPLVIGPKWCLEDGEKDAPFFPCVGCFRTVRIADKSCPRCHWPACAVDCKGLTSPTLHGLECPVLCTRSGPKAESTTDHRAFLNFYRSDVLLTLRCLMLQFRFPEKWKKVQELESHDEQRKETKYYVEAEERIVSFLRNNFLLYFDELEQHVGATIIPQRDKRTLHRICGIMEVNALNIGVDNEQDQEVSALFELACVLEHSCTPNCYYTFDPRRNYKITMRAGRTIRKGEHLSIMYTHMLWGTQMRQAHLWTNKYFICRCERCCDRTELGTYLSAIKCIGAEGKCGGMLLLQEPLETTTNWLCDRCDVCVSSEEVDVVLANIEQEVDAMLAPIDTQKPCMPNEIENLLAKLEKLLHPNHYHMFALKHTLVQMYGQQKGYLLFELTDDVLAQKIEMCEQLLCVVDVLDPNMMRLSLYTGIILYELHMAVLEKGRRHKLDLGSYTIQADVLSKAKEYLVRGKTALALYTADMPQGRKLIEAFDKAAENLDFLFENLKI